MPFIPPGKPPYSLSTPSKYPPVSQTENQKTVSSLKTANCIGDTTEYLLFPNINGENKKLATTKQDNLALLVNSEYGTIGEQFETRVAEGRPIVGRNDTQQIEQNTRPSCSNNLKAEVEAIDNEIKDKAELVSNLAPEITSNHVAQDARPKTKQSTPTTKSPIKQSPDTVEDSNSNMVIVNEMYKDHKKHVKQENYIFNITELTHPINLLNKIMLNQSATEDDEKIKDICKDIRYKINILYDSIGFIKVSIISFNKNNTVTYAIDQDNYNKINSVTRLLAQLAVFINKPSNQSHIALSYFIHFTSGLNIIKKKFIEQAIYDIKPYNAFSVIIIKKIIIQTIEDSIKSLQLLAVANKEHWFYVLFFLQLKNIFSLSAEYLENSKKINTKDIFLLLHEEANKKLVLTLLDQAYKKIFTSNKQVFENLLISMLGYFIFGETTQVFTIIDKTHKLINNNYSTLFNQYIVDANPLEKKQYFDELNDTIENCTKTFIQYSQLIAYIFKDEEQQKLHNHIYTTLNLYRFYVYAKECVHIYIKTHKLDNKQQQSAINSVAHYSTLNNTITDKLEAILAAINRNIDATIQIIEPIKTTKKTQKKQAANQDVVANSQDTDDLLQTILDKQEKLNNLDDDEKNSILECIFEKPETLNNYKFQQRNKIQQLILDKPEKLTRFKRIKKDILIRSMISDERILNQLDHKQKGVLLQLILAKPKGLTDLTNINYRIIFELMLYEQMQTSNYNKTDKMFDLLIATNNEFAIVLGNYGKAEIALCELNNRLHPVRKQSKTQETIDIVQDILINQGKLLNDKSLIQKFKETSILYYSTKQNHETAILNKIDVLEKSLDKLIEGYLKQPEIFGFLEEATQHLCMDHASIRIQIKTFDSIIDKLLSLNQTRKQLLKDHGLIAKEPTELNKQLTKLSIKIKNSSPLSEYFSDELFNKISAINFVSLFTQSI